MASIDDLQSHTTVEELNAWIASTDDMIGRVPTQYPDATDARRDGMLRALESQKSWYRQMIRRLLSDEEGEVESDAATRTA